jgi:hypothetical protein
LTAPPKTHIEGLINTATAVHVHFLNLPPAQLTGTVPSPIKSAALLLIGTLYNDREARETGRTTKPSRLVMLAPYRFTYKAGDLDQKVSLERLIDGVDELASP